MCAKVCAHAYTRMHMYMGGSGEFLTCFTTRRYFSERELAYSVAGLKADENVLALYMHV